MCKKVMIIGAGGHAKVIVDIVIKSGDEVIGFVDDNIEKGTEILGFKVLGKIIEIDKYLDCEFIIGIGDNSIRKQIAEKFPKLKYYTAIHPTVVIGMDVAIQAGTVIMANVVINPCTQIGKHCIINTASVVEHDSNIQNYVHISPNASLGGNVTIGELTHIGIGATVKNNVNICNSIVIGAGAVVVEDMKEEGVYIGIPARKCEK